MSIKKATVLGAGVMGSQIAALLVNAGLEVQILDIVVDEENRNKLSKGAVDRITNRKKSQLYDQSFASQLTYGNLSDDLSEPSDSDIFIEAVAEKLEIKHDLWTKVAKIAKDEAILATNTSGIPIEQIADALDESSRERFVGLHFFNPPRFMKLVELIPNTKTSEATIDKLNTFVIDNLGKGLVPANDVSGFIANRIGNFTNGDIVVRAEEQGLSIPETDAITGTYIGRPKMGTYKLSDMVGIDIAYNVTKGLLNDPEEAEHFKMPDSLEKLYEAGNLGNKSGKGYYKKEGKQRFVVDLETLEYQPLERPKLPIQKELGRNLKDNLQVIFNSDDTHGLFLWETLRNVFHYSALNVPKASDDYKNIDRAMVWGYNWELGPFQLWDLMGFEKVKNRIKEELGDLPEWVESRTESFYDEGESISYIDDPASLIEEEIWNRPDTYLGRVNETQLLIKMQSPSNTITSGFSKDMREAVELLETEDYTSLVLYSEGSNFCVGANLNNVRECIEADAVDEELPLEVDSLHATVKAIRSASKPVVAAAQGRALGGGAELLLAAPYVVAAAESYIGLVEAGVGLVPSGGGLAELTDRILRVNEKQGNRIARLAKLVQTVSTGYVSSNAYEAKANGFLRDTDIIIQNDELRVFAALSYADFLSEYGYRPLTDATYEAPGINFKAVVEGELDAMRLGHFISDYDKEVGLAIADVVSGGELPSNTQINHDYLLSKEKEHFVKLAKNEKTYDRIVHMLEKKRPLRN